MRISAVKPVSWLAVNLHQLRLRVLTVAPSENRWWRFTANQETGFTAEMRMLVEFD